MIWQVSHPASGIWLLIGRAGQSANFQSNQSSNQRSSFSFITNQSSNQRSSSNFIANQSSNQRSGSKYIANQSSNQMSCSNFSANQSLNQRFSFNFRANQSSNRRFSSSVQQIKVKFKGLVQIMNVSKQWSVLTPGPIKQPQLLRMPVFQQ